MSTKTTFKRIALGTVAAMGFGLLSVVPANAAPVNAATATVASYNATRVTTSCVVNTACVVNVGANVLAQAADSTSANNLQIRTMAYLSTFPAGGASAITAGVPGTPNAIDTATTTASGNVLVSAWANNTAIVAENVVSTSTAATGGFGNFSFTPAVTGTYVLTIWNDADAGTDVDLNETANTISITVGTAVSGLTELGNAAVTTASTGTNLVGMIVPSVGVTIDEVSGRVAQMVGFAPHYFIKRNAGNASASADTNTAKANLNYTVTNPAGTAVSVVTAKVAGVASTEQNVQGDAGALQNSSTSTTTTTTTSTKGSVVYFNPATAGTYTITVWHDADGNDLVSAGEASGTKTVVIAADALPSITFTKYGSNPTAAQSADTADYTGTTPSVGYGQLVKVSLRNGTTPFTLAANESLVLTSAASTTNFLAHTAFAKDVNTWTDVAASAATLTLTKANFNSNGDAWINVGDTTTAGGTFSVSAVISGGTANGASGSFTITTIATSGTGSYTLIGNSTTSFTNANDGLGVEGATIANGTASANWDVKLGVATTVSAKVVSGVNDLKLYSGLVVDTLGLITGVPGARYNVNATTLATGSVATSAVSLSVAIPATTAALASGTSVAMLYIDEDGDIAITIRAESSAVTSLASDPSDLVGDYSLRAAAASTNKFTAYVYDQFGNAVSGAAVTAAVTGRNATAVSTTLLSDASGAVSFSVADTYVGTLLNSDSLVFTSNGQTTTVTINYAAYNPASTVAITGGASADTGTTVTLSQISTAVAGASASTALVKMTATVKDANGATLPAGIPVKWAISGLTGTSAILVDATTGYDWSTSMTNSNGEAITYVYAWGTGTVSVTATAGAVTSATAGKINFANAAADARVVSATAGSNGVITAKVVDRYGNGVKGVSITATRTAGTGYFGGNAASSTSGETNANGTVDFIVVGGEATVTVATTTLNAGQTSSAAGFVGATAVTATGIGASLAPAGVQSVSVTVAGNTSTQDAATAAADAAAEATDAANAATDAANAAAEAADAATAAAQDAADAVAALSTQVTELVSALRKQITSLTNLVIKIQRKVRA
jgi:trimeric autotransporter adhesin